MLRSHTDEYIVVYNVLMLCLLGVELTEKIGLFSQRSQVCALLNETQFTSKRSVFVSAASSCQLSAAAWTHGPF